MQEVASSGLTAQHFSAIYKVIQVAGHATRWFFVHKLEFDNTSVSARPPHLRIPLRLA
jgi:hypothetical protein